MIILASETEPDMSFAINLQEIICESPLNTLERCQTNILIYKSENFCLAYKGSSKI